MPVMRTTIGVSALLVAVAAALVAHDAHALGPLDLEIAARAGGATRPGGGDGPNLLGFGLGGRAGVSIVGLYGGLSLINYFGESQSAAGITASGHALLYGVEGGYGSTFGPLTLRGTVGVGNIGETVSVTGLPDATHNGLYIEPGVTGLIAIGMWLIGADANVLILPNDGGSSSLDAAFTVHGQLGVKF